MRVATRRLRAALDLFAEVLPVRAQVFREELGWAGRVLGAVRDLDVQLEGLADIASSIAGWSAATRAADHDPLHDLSELLDARTRERPGRHALRPRLDPLGAPAQGPDRHGPAGAGASLARLTAAGRDGPPRPDRGTPPRRDQGGQARQGARARSPDFHRVRIRCKRLRYALEFGAEVYDGRTARFVRQLTALQDELGLMQDDEVASIQLAGLATGEAHLPRATVFVMGALAERHRRDVDRRLRRLPKELSRVEGREWRALRSLLERRRARAEADLPPPRPSLRALPRPQPEPEAREGNDAGRPGVRIDLDAHRRIPHVRRPRPVSLPAVRPAASGHSARPGTIGRAGRGGDPDPSRGGSTCAGRGTGARCRHLERGSSEPARAASRRGRGGHGTADTTGRSARLAVSALHPGTPVVVGRAAGPAHFSSR